MTYTSPPALQLWHMQPHIFNEWRAENDLPDLFDFLIKILPGFENWLHELPFNLDVALRITPTGDLFKGDKKVVIKRDGDFPNTDVFECYDGTVEDAKKFWALRQSNVTILGEIEPYFKWAKRTLGRKRFFTWDKVNSQISEKFIRGSCSGINEKGCITQAHLFRDFTLLKMGQVCIDRLATIGGKNLDFCDLDFLEITGTHHRYGAAWKTINYSSFRDFSFKNADVYFFKFHECWLDKLSIKNSNIQDFHFEKTNVNELRLENSYVHKMSFKDSHITPFILNSELREINFKPNRQTAPLAIATTYRMFRAAYQSNGLRQEASECYYNERVFERKSYFNPSTINTKKFGELFNGGRFSIVFDLYKKGIYQSSDLPAAIRNTLISKIKMYTLPKFLIPLLGYKIKWMASGFEYILWGYGERPLRIILVALAIIATYAGIYSTVNWADNIDHPTHLSLLDSVYFSVVTFTTLGYGDITPKTTLLKLLASSEAMLGAFSMGLIVAGFSNKSRY